MKQEQRKKITTDRNQIIKSIFDMFRVAGFDAQYTINLICKRHNLSIELVKRIVYDNNIETEMKPELEPVNHLNN